MNRKNVLCLALVLRSVLVGFCDGGSQNASSSALTATNSVGQIGFMGEMTPAIGVPTRDTAGQASSAESNVAMQQPAANETDPAEKEVSLGLKYSQITGSVDPAKAIVHFTAALGYHLPEKTYIQVLMWRGNCQEQLKKPNEALTDYLRGLLACSYYDLAGGWPEIQSSKLPIFINSSDPENAQRVKDYKQYRERIDFQQFLLMQRYYFIEAVKRVRPAAATNDVEIVKILEVLSPDSSRYGPITGWLKSENKRPWP